MKKMIRKALSIFTCISLIAGLNLPVKAVDDKLELKFRIDSNIMLFNERQMVIEKPFLQEGNTFVPLSAVVEAFGAEVNWNGDGKLNLSYRDTAIDMKLGEVSCTVDNEETLMPAAPLLINESTMVPLRFIAERFGAQVDYEPSSQSISIFLEDDGALEDLSFLTKSIGNLKVGNSYFGWSLNVPKGSQINNSSFNSKDINIINEKRKINLDISVDVNEGKKWDEYFKEIKDEPEKLFAGKLIDSSISSNTEGLSYMEFIYRGYYEGLNISRIFMNDKYIYKINLSSYEETNLEKLKENTYLKNIFESFRMDYNGSSPDIQDLSKVKNGVVKYENYTWFNYSEKHPTWEMSVPPEWEGLNLSNSNPLEVRIGLNSKEYIGVELKKANSASDISDYGEMVRKLYDTNYNPKYYKHIEKKEIELANSKAYKLVSEITMGAMKYILDENFILAGDIIYVIAIKAPEEKYRTEIQKYNSILNSFIPTSKDLKSLGDEIDRQSGIKDTLGKDEKPVDYANKEYKWSLKMPGYWLKNSFDNERSSTFINPDTGAAIIVMATESNLATRSITDSSRLEFIKNITQDKNVKQINKQTLSDKGGSVQLFTYRIENEDQEMYTDLKFYEVQKESYTYYFFSILPDLCTTDKNLKEMQSIWSSFKFSN